MKKTINVFIIEDDSIFSQMLSDLVMSLNDLLKVKNIEIIYKTFYSADEALFELSDKIDVVLLDYYILDDNLELQTADKVIARIKAIDPAIQVIVVSGQENELIKRALLHSGASDYIQKNPNAFIRLEQVLLKAAVTISKKQ